MTVTPPKSKTETPEDARAVERGLRVAAHGAETVQQAAVSKDGKVYAVPRPARHPQAILAAWAATGRPVTSQDTQGFITSTGRFVARPEAAKIAFEAGQTDRLILTITSEDLW